MAPQGFPLLAELPSGPPATDTPVQVGDRLWWVGHDLPGRRGRCQAYLLEQGDQSVLFDPGSGQRFRHTLRKIEQLVPLSHIKWFVCHHPTPNVTGAMPLIDQLVSRDDARVVTHGRAADQLQHLDLRMPFWRVEAHDWQLPLADRTLRFVGTPYAHSAGAFTSFEPRSGTLLSGDLFSGEPEAGSELVAQDVGYFDAMRPFHQAYLPSQEILAHAVDQVLALPVRQVAPQRGCIIPAGLVRPLLGRLRQLECGLYLLDDTNVQRRSHLNRLLRHLTQTLLAERDFKTIAGHLLRAAAEVMPVVGLEFYVTLDDGQTLRLCPEERFHGAWVDVPDAVAATLALSPERWRREGAQAVQELDFGGHVGKPGVLVPLFLAGSGKAGAVVVARLSEEAPMEPILTDLLERLGPALEVAVGREALHRSLERERNSLYERSIRDSLTGLYTRRHLFDVASRWTDFQDRDDDQMISVILFDLDHFKRVNDTWGHAAGDTVLQQVAGIIQAQCRGGDLPVRMGGEEFGLFLFGDNPDAAPSLAARVVAKVRAARFEGALADLRLTISAGTTCRQAKEPIAAVIARADEALYAAKAGGRDRVETR